jgi:transcriptional regulator with PAS, ATPase and Fis domain
LQQELTLDLALLILDMIDTVSITDKEGRYIYKNKKWRERRIKSEQNPDAAYPWEIIKNSKVAEIIRTQKPYIGHIVEFGNTFACCNYYPVFRNGAFWGVLIWTFFTGLDNAVKFSGLVRQLMRELEESKEQIRQLSSTSYKISNIVGESSAVLELKNNIRKAARTRSNILIEGETGVGKELVAQAIHELSPRRQAAFVRVNCAAIPQELMESEFFGYDDGAFTGAKKGGKLGKFELSSGGSLFLDEIGNIPLALQPKFLRVLQEQEVEHIGGEKPIPVDMRIIAASNVDLYELVRNKVFREDLYYRLNVFRIKVPPLRERKEDIPLLARALISTLNYHLDMHVNTISPEVLRFFCDYNWPGNIRELRNVLERAMNLAEDETISLGHVRPYFGEIGRPSLNNGSACRKNLLKESKDAAERQKITEAIDKYNGNKTSAIKSLGISRSSFYKKLKKFGL